MSPAHICRISVASVCNKAFKHREGIRGQSEHILIQLP